MEHLRHHLSNSCRDCEDPPPGSREVGPYGSSPAGAPQAWHHGQGAAFQGSPTMISPASYSDPHNIQTVSPTTYSNPRPGFSEPAQSRTLPPAPGPVNSYSYGTNPVPGNYGVQDPDLGRLNLGSSPNPGQLHPAHRPQAPTYISNTSYNSFGSIGTNLDASYAMKPERYFEPGRVFSCLFTETAGETCRDRLKNPPRFAKICYGEYAYSNILRFVVIQTRHEQKFSLCCPIKTYGHRGATKYPGHHQHLIIYTGNVEPDPMLGEEFKNKGIQMIPVDNTAALDSRSRLNLGKPTPVEHNIRVKHLGDINKDHMYRLFRYYAHVNNTDGLAAKARTYSTSGVRPSRSTQERYDDDDDEDDERAVEEDDEEEEEGEGEEYELRAKTAPRTSVNNQRQSMRGRAPSVGGRSGHPPAMPTRTERSGTMRSSPVPFGSQRAVTLHSRRLSEQLEPPAPDSRSRRDSKEYPRRGDRERWY